MTNPTRIFILAVLVLVAYVSLTVMGLDATNLFYVFLGLLGALGVVKIP